MTFPMTCLAQIKGSTTQIERPSHGLDSIVRTRDPGSYWFCQPQMGDLFYQQEETHPKAIVW